MGEEVQHRRKYKRVFYSVQDKMVGFFSCPSQGDKGIVANVMNMSVGGLHFTLKRDDNIKLKVGDHLILTKIVGNAPIQLVVNIETKIKWVLDHHLMKHIGYGCEFMDLPDIVKEQIVDFVDTEWVSSSLNNEAVQN
ncbi:MAG: PilZ domain-containing protein [Proteobacteria bacterium]|nr:PilZ domain-containing protein [Pseudomonadota bacterium]MBU1709257.1 PilZ domain-containing protein [Pseudomonadota bacterium]